MYKNIVFDFGGVMVDFDPHKYLIDLFGNRGLEEEVYDLTFGSREWRLLDAGRITRREANEFIVYWLPHMEGNAYNLIAFQTSSYTDHARLTADPAPDTVLRVFMAWKPLDRSVELPPQTLAAPVRTGFTLVEWGGAEIS